MVLAGGIGVLALQRGGIPSDAGQAPNSQRLASEGWKVYLGIALAVPVIALLVQRDALAGAMLMIFGFLAFTWLIMQAIQRDKVARERLYVALILMFFSMMFWAFFEQAGSSINNFTDRNIDRVIDDTRMTASAGEVIDVVLNQEQVGYKVDLTQEQLYGLLAPSLSDLPAKKLLPYAKEKLTGVPNSLDELGQQSAVPDGLTLDEAELQTLSGHLQAFLAQLLDKRTREALGLDEAVYTEMNTDKQLVAVYEKLTGTPMPTALDALKTQAREQLGLTDEELARAVLVVDLQRRLAHVPLGLTREGLKNKSVDELRALAQRLLNYQFDGNALVVTINVRDELRSKKNEKVQWQVSAEHATMNVDGAEMPASIFQSVNAIFIILLAPFFSALWSGLAARGFEPSTPVKFALGVTQLGLGFACLWIGAQQSDDRGMVWMGWLLASYFLQTTGELCLSPVGLSMVTKLSPADIVSTVMGAWFMATAFSNYLAGMIATLTGVSHGEDSSLIPAPIHTVHVYGDVFGKIALTAVVVGLLCFALSPLLTRWMHQGVEAEPAPEQAADHGASQPAE
jgi:dipeptide/tripeptide permease